MKQTDWQQIEQILASILELPEDQRSAQIEQLCAGNASLRNEVLSLLTAHKRAGSFLEVKTQISSESAGSVSLISNQLGPYRLLEPIGHGGMGTVYRAERADGQFQKQVAVKVVPAAVHSQELLRRFTSEQQILASLEHPNIARLMDAGVSPEGLPYLVMEHVEGVPITDYCRDRRLPLQERLRLFQTVCSTVHYAHQHLIVHRDIKPANILVTKEGSPKLLDFGIAKLLDPWMNPGAGSTQSIFNPMTPDYASPEQARGEALTTATDVYSLAVILYELLANQRPYSVADKPSTEAIRMICELEPEKPSALVRNRMKKDPSVPREHGLSSELDAVVAKAMRKDPQQRYGSAQDLAQDISRYLGGQTVLAHRGSLRYIAGKFITRHKAGVLAAAVTVILAAGGVAGIVRQGRIAERERTRAQRRFDEVRSLAKSLMFEVHDSIKDLPGTTTARKLIVSRALEYLDRLFPDASDDAGLQRELAAAYERLGDVQGNPEISNLGDPRGALASYSKAAALRQSLLKTYQNDSALKLELSGTLFKIGICRDASGDLPGALSHLQKARSLAEQSGLDRQDPSLVDALAAAHWAIARVTREQGDLPAALEGYRTAVSLRESARVTSGPQKAEFRIRIAASYREIAEVLRQQKQYAAAVEAAREYLAALESASLKDPDNATLNQWVGAGYETLGICLEDAGQLDQALDNFQKGRTISKSAMAKDPSDTNASRVAGYMDMQVGRVLVKKGHPTAALPLMNEALRIFENLAKSSPESSYLSENLANVYSELGMTHAALGSDIRLPRSARRDYWAQARSWYRRSREVWLEKQRQGTLLSENSGEPDRISGEIENCARALAHLR